MKTQNWLYVIIGSLTLWATVATGVAMNEGDQQPKIITKTVPIWNQAATPTPSPSTPPVITYNISACSYDGHWATMKVDVYNSTDQTIQWTGSAIMFRDGIGVIDSSGFGGVQSPEIQPGLSAEVSMIDESYDVQPGGTITCQVVNSHYQTLS